MNFIHPITKTPCRILRLSALSSRKRKVLVGIQADDTAATAAHKSRLMNVYVGLKAIDTKAQPSSTCVGLLLAAPEEGVAEYLCSGGDNHESMPLIFVSRAVLQTLNSPIRAENLIVIDDMHNSYEYIGHQWNGTVDDAIAAIGLLCKANQIVCNADVISPMRVAACGKYGIEILSKFTPEPLTVYTQAYKIERGMRRREIMESLNHNANNPYVDKVVVFVDNLQSVQMERITGPGKSKIQLVEGGLKTVRGIWDYIATSGTSGFACILKEDCFLDNSIGHIWSMQMTDTCLALSRDDYKEERTPRDMPTMQPDNQEAWIMRVEDISERALPDGALEFQMGAQIYGMAIAAALLKGRFVLKNPSASIKVHHHHESKIHVGKKPAPPLGDVFIQCAPTMLQDREMILNMRPYALMDSGKQIMLEATPFDRPLLGMTVSQTKTFTTMKNRLNRGEDYVWMEPPSKNTFRGSLGLCKWSNAFVNGDGIVSTIGNVFIGGGSVAGQAKEFPERFWGKSVNYPYGLTSTTSAMAAIPITADRIQDIAKYVVYYFARAISLRKKLDCNVSAWYNPAVQKLFSNIFRAPVDGEVLTLVPYNASRSVAADVVYGYEPSEESQWVWHDDIAVLRSMLNGPQADSNPKMVLLTEPVAGLLDTFRGCEELAGWEFSVAPGPEDPLRMRAAYEGAGIVIMTPESAPWQWLSGGGSKVIELQFENKQAVEHLNISNASGLTHYIRILPPRTDDVTLRKKQFEAVRIQLLTPGF